MRKFVEPDVADNPLYHDTWKLLKKYRDVVWSLELSVQHVRTMFEISDVLIDKEEVAMTLNIHLELPETAETEESHSISEHEVIVSDALSSVSKSHIETILRKMADILSTQGISCFSCPLSRYKLYPLSDDCWEELIPRARGKSTAHFGLTILCGTNTSIATFELTLTPFEEHENRRNLK